MPQKDKAKIILFGTLLSIAGTLVLILPMAFFVTIGLLPISWSLGSVLVAVALGTFWGGFFTSRRMTSHKLIAAVLTGALTFLTFLIAGFLVSSPPGRHSVFILGASLLFSAFGAVFSERKRPARH